MTKTRRQVLAATGALAGASALAACGGAAGETGGGGTGGTASNKTPVTIGATISTTGASAAGGKLQKEAYELWAEQAERPGPAG